MGAFVINYGSMSKLSFQQVYDCVDSLGPSSGSYLPQQLMDYITHKGLCSEAGYPSTGNKETCHDTACQPVLPPGTTWNEVTADNESALERALSRQPVVVLLNAEPLQTYR